MQIWVIELPPAGELADLEAIALLSGLAAGPTALADEPLGQQRIAPEDSAGLGRIKKSKDVCERLCLVHAVQNSGELFG